MGSCVLAKRPWCCVEWAGEERPLSKDKCVGKVSDITQHIRLGTNKHTNKRIERWKELCQKERENLHFKIIYCSFVCFIKCICNKIIGSQKRHHYENITICIMVTYKIFLKVILVYLFICLLIYLLAAFFDLFIYFYIHSFIHLFNHSFIYAIHYELETK